MAQTVSEEELQAKRDRLTKLRDQITTEESKAAERTAEQERLIEAARLDAEAARLELQLQVAKDAAKVSTVKEGTAPVLASAKDQMKAAEAALAEAKSGEGSPGAPKDPSPEEVAETTNKDKE